MTTKEEKFEKKTSKLSNMDERKEDVILLLRSILAADKRPMPVAQIQSKPLKLHHKVKYKYSKQFDYISKRNITKKTEKVFL